VQQTYSRASFVVVVIALLCTGIAATLWLSTQATADSYQLEHLTGSTQHLRQRVDDLQRDVMREEYPQSLARRAKAMGMVPAGDPAKLVTGPHGKVRVLGKDGAKSK
jgi:cell division protein FtsB